MMRITLGGDGDHPETFIFLLKSKIYDTINDWVFDPWIGDDIEHFHYRLNKTMSWACTTGDVEAVNILSNRGATVNMPSYSVYGGPSYSPLHYACMYGHSDVVKVLLEKGADIKFDTIIGPIRSSLLLLACKHGHADVVNVLLDNGADVNENISIYCDCNGTKFCRLYTPLYVAWMSSHSDVIKLLLKRGANTDVLW